METNSQLNSEHPPKCDVMFLFLNEITKAIEKSGYSRSGIVDRMNEALGGEIRVTIDMLNKWLAPSSDRQIPMLYLGALAWAVRSVSVVDILLSPLQHKTTDLRGQKLRQAAELQLKAQRLSKEADELMADVSSTTSH